MFHLSGGDGLAETSTTLTVAQAGAVSNLLGLLDDLLSLGEDELNVAGVRHVRVDLLWTCQHSCPSFGHNA